MKLLKKKLLFSLASEPGTEYKTLNFLYFRLSEFTSGSVRDAAGRLEKAGYLDKINRDNQSFFRLTILGKEMVKQPAPVWDKQWRLVVLTNSRGYSRAVERVLVGLGYRRMSRGVYITPFLVGIETKQLFLKHNWQNLGQIMEVKRLVLGDDQQLVKKLWRLEDIGQQYADFITSTARLLKLSRQNFALLQQAKGGFKTCFDHYFNLRMVDPGLPKALWPQNWPADEARELFTRLVVVAKTAQL